MPQVKNRLITLYLIKPFSNVQMLFLDHNLNLTAPLYIDSNIGFLNEAFEQTNLEDLSGAAGPFVFLEPWCPKGRQKRPKHLF